MTLTLPYKTTMLPLPKEARLSEQVFEASERALERAYKTTERVSSQDFERALRVELKRYGF